MKRHHDDHIFVPGTRRTGQWTGTGFKGGSYIGPSLTERGVDVDEFIQENRPLIERMREGKDKE